jgi:isoleucyl-tRNA synthetase
LDQDDIDILMKCGSLKKDIGGNSLEITSGDVDVKRIGITGWAIASDGDLGVGVDTTVTDELKNEGLVRELIHKIQLMRKEADFDLTDRIKIYYETDTELKKAIQANLDYLKAETLAKEVSEGVIPGEAQNVLNINGIETKITLQRVKTA